MATIKIPPVLRASVGGEKEVSASGENVGDVLRDLASSHPATQSQLFSAEGELNRYVNVYLNDEDVRVLDGLDTAVGAGDTLVILPADGRRLTPAHGAQAYDRLPAHQAAGERPCAASPERPAALLAQLIRKASVAGRSSGLANRKP